MHLACVLCSEQWVVHFTLSPLQHSKLKWLDIHYKKRLFLPIPTSVYLDRHWHHLHDKCSQPFFLRPMRRPETRPVFYIILASLVFLVHVLGGFKLCTVYLETSKLGYNISGQSIYSTNKVWKSPDAHMSQVLVKLGSSLLYSQCLLQTIVSGSAVHQSLLVVCSSLKTGTLTHSVSTWVSFYCYSIVVMSISSCCTVDGLSLFCYH